MFSPSVDCTVSAGASSKPLDEAEIYAKLMEGFPDPVVDLPELGNRFRDLLEVIDT